MATLPRIKHCPPGQRGGTPPQQLCAAPQPATPHHAQAALAGKAPFKSCLPTGHGVRVPLSELAKGAAASGGSPAADLLATRPLLQQLQYSMQANDITMGQVLCHAAPQPSSAATAQLRRCFRTAAATHPVHIPASAGDHLQQHGLPLRQVRTPAGPLPNHPLVDCLPLRLTYFPGL